jgi:hypothetical protein
MTNRRVETKRHKKIYFTGKSLPLATCLLTADPHCLTLPLLKAQSVCNSAAVDTRKAQQKKRLEVNYEK